MATCSISDVAGHSQGRLRRGMCRKHYERWKKYGDPLRSAVIMGDDVRRFWSKVDRTDGCWLWRGTVIWNTHSPYGRFVVRGYTNHMAHRYAYELLVGDIPDGLQLDHLCRTTLCVNPDHLEPVTPRENTMRGIGPAAVNARKTHCIHGHPFDEENTYITPRGTRDCRRCRSRAAAKSKASRRGAN